MFERNSSLVSTVFTLAILFCVSTSDGSLVFFYDPISGNVSFDTSQTRSGHINSYSLTLNPYASEIRFDPGEHVQLTSSTLVTSEELGIGEGTLSSQMSGLLTIGDVLPPGIPEGTWAELFNRTGRIGLYSPGDTELGDSGYSDVVGGGRPPLATFVYGRPEREFDNRWDLVDPDSLVWANSARLIYRAQTGRLLLDTTGRDSGFVSGFLLNSNGQFRADRFRPPVEGIFNNATESVLAVFVDAIEPGRYNLGKVLDPHLSPSQLFDLFTNASFVGRAGFGGNLDIDFASDSMPLTLQYSAVPEPASVIFVAIGLGLTLASRGRAMRPVARAR